MCKGDLSLSFSVYNLQCCYPDLLDTGPLSQIVQQRCVCPQAKPNSLICVLHLSYPSSTASSLSLDLVSSLVSWPWTLAADQAPSKQHEERKRKKKRELFLFFFLLLLFKYLLQSLWRVLYKCEFNFECYVKYNPDTCEKKRQYIEIHPFFYSHGLKLFHWNRFNSRLDLHTRSIVKWPQRLNLAHKRNILPTSWKQEKHFFLLK